MKSLSRADRRTFLRSGALGAGALWISSLQELSARRAHGEYSHGRSKKKGGRGPDAYGLPSPKPDETTGLNLLQLPDGFRYWSYSWTGDVMSDGVMCPNLHDGMAVVDEWPTKDDDDRHEKFDGRYRSKHDKGGRSGRDRDGNDRWDDDDRDRSSRLVLVRNHETANGAPYLNRPAITYANDGAGGTTNLLFDARKGKWLEAWSSLAGTVRNCAGAVTPWGTWISQEETVVAGHGWSFEVGATKDCSIGGPTPLHDMGRFSHEASMVDPKTGFVYETEDSGDCGFYRFVPYSRGKLIRGGKLYMMSVKDRPERGPRRQHSRRDDVGRPLGADRRPRGDVAVLLRPGQRQRRRALPAPRRRLVGRRGRVLRVHRRGERARGAALRVRPSG